MSKNQENTFETPSNSESTPLNLKRKSCPPKLECKTPRSDLGTPLNSMFLSSRRPSRLNESQKAQLRQRRLEFLTSKTESPEKTNADATPRDLNSLNREELIALIKQAETELNTRNEHERKVKELRECIDRWKIGFNQVLGDLQSKLQTKNCQDTSKRSILRDLRVSSKVLKYLDDPED